MWITWTRLWSGADTDIFVLGAVVGLASCFGACLLVAGAIKRDAPLWVWLLGPCATGLLGALLAHQRAEELRHTLQVTATFEQLQHLSAASMHALAPFCLGLAAVALLTAASALLITLTAYFGASLERSRPLACLLASIATLLPFCFALWYTLSDLTSLPALPLVVLMITGIAQAAMAYRWSELAKERARIGRLQLSVSALSLTAMLAACASLLMRAQAPLIMIWMVPDEALALVFERASAMYAVSVARARGSLPRRLVLIFHATLAAALLGALGASTMVAAHGLQALHLHEDAGALAPQTKARQLVGAPLGSRDALLARPVCVFEHQDTGWQAHPSPHVASTCGGPLFIPTLLMDRGAPVLDIARREWGEGEQHLQLLTRREPAQGLSHPELLRAHHGSIDIIWSPHALERTLSEPELARTLRELEESYQVSAQGLEDAMFGQGGMPHALALSQDSQGYFVVTAQGIARVSFLEHASPEHPTYAELVRALGEQLSGRDAPLIVPGDDWSVQKFVEVCAALDAATPAGAQAHPKTRETLRCFINKITAKQWFERVMAMLKKRELLNERAHLHYSAQVDRGAISLAAVEAGINRQHYAIRSCYERELKAHGSFGGRVVANFTIKKNGRVEQVTLSHDTLHNEALSRCIVERISGTRFVRPAYTTTVSFPLSFNALN